MKISFLRGFLLGGFDYIKVKSELRWILIKRVLVHRGGIREMLLKV